MHSRERADPPRLRDGVSRALSFQGLLAVRTLAGAYCHTVLLEGCLPECLYNYVHNKMKDQGNGDAEFRITRTFADKAGHAVARRTLLHWYPDIIIKTYGT